MQAQRTADKMCARRKMMKESQVQTEVKSIDLTEWAEGINSGLEEGTPLLIISADKTGHPDIAIKGSVMVFDKDHLAYWERSRAEQVEQIEENPNVVVFYRNPTRKVPHMRVYGEAEVHHDDAIREQIMARTIQ